MFCLAGSSTSMSRGHLTNGRGMSEATKPVIKRAVFRETFTLQLITGSHAQDNVTVLPNAYFGTENYYVLREIISRFEFE